MTNSMSNCLKRLKSREIHCYKRKATVKTAQLTNKVIVKESIEYSVDKLTCKFNNTNNNSNNNNNNERILISVHPLPTRNLRHTYSKQNKNTLQSVDNISTVSDNPTAAQPNLQTVLKKQPTKRCLILDSQHEQLWQQSETFENPSNNSENDKENMNNNNNNSRRPIGDGSMCRLTKPRGLRHSNRNDTTDSLQSSNTDNSKSSVSNHIIRYRQFHKPSLIEINTNTFSEHEHNYLSLINEFRRKPADICYTNTNFITRRLFITESTKLMTALFFNELPGDLAGGGDGRGQEKGIKIDIFPKNPAKNDFLFMRRQRHSAVGGFDYYGGGGGECGCHQQFTLSLPRSPIDDLNVGEFHVNHGRIFRYLFTQDLKSRPYYQVNFLERLGLSDTLRSTLCDWMIKVQHYLHLRTESLHLAVNLVDQYTWRQNSLEATEYQLFGITAIFIAAKFVERFPPSTKTLCYLTEDTYNAKQLLRCECEMLQALDFEINIPLPHHFLDRGILACADLTVDGKTKVELICRYLFELILTESSTVGISAIVKCAAGLYLSRELLRLKCERDTSRRDENPLHENDNNILLDPSKKFETWPESIGESMGQESLVRLLPMVLIYVQRLIKFLPNSNIEEVEYAGAFHKFSNRSYGKIALSDIILEADYDLIVRDIDEKLTINSDSSL
ncbi:unnamed protein product [Trichobilharzia szidati]|nr:unnamed protein product [Trichobilharzia szidati]